MDNSISMGYYINDFYKSGLQITQDFYGSEMKTCQQKPGPETVLVFVVIGKIFSMDLTDCFALQKDLN